MSAAAGDFIYRENDASADMYIIRNGQVELLKQNAGSERQVALLEAGDFFGETSLLEDHARETSARAVGAVELLRIDATTFDRIVQEAPEIPVRMLRKMCRRLREYQDQESRAAAIAMGPLSVGGSVRAPGGVAPAAAAPAPAPAPPASDRVAVLVDPTSNKMFEL